MSTRDLQPVFELLDLLESRFAIRMLWVLRDGHPQTFRLLQDSVGGATPNTLNTRLKELREAGLVTRVRIGYTVTPAGAELARRLGEIQPFAHRWSATRAAALAATTPAEPSQPAEETPDHARPLTSYRGAP